MGLPLYTVDAFTDKPFGGNQAGVVILEKPAEEAWMQSVAAEMNIAETAFLSPHSDPFKRAYDLRWFTPTVEIALCGHGTLASAHILWTEGYYRPNETAKFFTKSGLLTATRDEQTLITLDFPAKLEESADAPAGLAEALGVDIGYVGKNQFDYLVELDSAETVINLKPDLAAIKELPVRGVIVTAKGGVASDFTSRFFAPASGIPEDPVTGSAHCCLAPYWGKKLGKTAMIGHQASPRGGFVGVELVGDRVLLKGKGVTVIKGELLA